MVQPNPNYSTTVLHPSEKAFFSGEKLTMFNPDGSDTGANGKITASISIFLPRIFSSPAAARG